MDSETYIKKQDPRQSKSQWIEIALIFVVFFVAGGAPVPHVNETHYLAKAKQYWNPEWLAGDLFLESGKAHLTFYWTVGLLTKWFSLPTVAWIGRIAAWLALAVSWHRLNRSAPGLPRVNLKLGGALSAALFVTLIEWTNFAGEWVVGGVEGKCFAYAFVFWGLALLAEEKWHGVWPCFGAAAAFHALVGGWSVVAAGLVWLTLPRGRRLPLLPMLPSLVLGGALALPGVLPALSLTQHVPPDTVKQANQIYVFQRLAHHLAPLALPQPELLRKACRFGALLVGFSLLWLVLQFVMSRQRAQSSPGPSACTYPLELLMRFALATLVISVIGLAWQLALWNHPTIAARFLKYYVFRLADIAVPLATSVGIVWLSAQLLRQRSRWAPALLLVAVALPLCHLLNVSWARFQNPTPPAVRSMRHPAAWLDACLWVRENTPPDSLFLVPRRAQSFKWYAQRSDLVTWKDVPQDAAALLVWRDRLNEVHRYRDEDGHFAQHSSLAIQGTARIRQLAERYELDYILTKEYPPLDLPVAYRNDRYVIYATLTPPTKTANVR